MVVVLVLGSLVALVVLFAVVVLLSRVVRRHEPSQPIDPAGRTFPAEFMWFTGEDAYQHEGGIRNNDWARMEESSDSPVPGGERNELAADFARRYEEDFDLAAAAGHQAHRIGVEWSRLEPEQGRYDETAFAHYEAMIASLRRRGLKVFLNIWHFTLPLWAADAGGWESDTVMEAWRQLVRTLARRFGQSVDFWSTMIDSQIYALQGYATGAIPPRVRDVGRAVGVYEKLVRAHAVAYHIIKEETDDTPVGQIYFFDIYEPKGIFPDTLVCEQLDSIFNTAYLDALANGRLDIDVIGGPSLHAKMPEARGTLDWLGVNYYRRQIISFDPTADGLVRQETRPGGPTTDMGWEIYPQGMYRVLTRLAARYPGVPLYITESGLADEEDDRRPDYILDHLAWTHAAIEDGVPVRGFAYWSLTDNWEWAEGYRPKFGLYEVDRTTGERRARGSARLYDWITKHNALPQRERVPGILQGESE